MSGIELFMEEGTGAVCVGESEEVPICEEEDNEVASLHVTIHDHLPSVDDFRSTSTTTNHGEAISKQPSCSSPPPIPYGNVDEDDEDDINVLSWRLDSNISLSDWTLQVVVKGSIRIDFYNVHKSVLAVGPRRSAYFAHTFHKASKQLKATSASPHRRSSRRSGGASDFNETFSDAMSVAPSLKDSIDSANSSNRIELHRLAAETIPALLDYMYSVNGELDIHTENASALHYLSGHLSIKSLRKASRQFWQSDISMENAAVYYGHARIFRDDKLIDFLVDYISAHIFEVSDALVVTILTSVDPPFFARVVQTIPTLHEEGSATLRLSLLVTVYANIHTVELSPGMFNKLTAEEQLPRLETKAARVLLELERDITADLSMTSLKARAIEVLAYNWDEACVEQSADQRIVTLPCLVGEPLEQFTQAALKRAHERLYGDDDEAITIPKLEARIDELEGRSPGQAERLLSLEQRQSEELRAAVDLLQGTVEEQHKLMTQQRSDLEQQLEDARNMIEAQKEQLKASKAAVAVAEASASEAAEQATEASSKVAVAQTRAKLAAAQAKAAKEENLRLIKANTPGKFSHNVETPVSAATSATHSLTPSVSPSTVQTGPHLLNQFDESVESINSEADGKEENHDYGTAEQRVEKREIAGTPNHAPKIRPHQLFNNGRDDLDSDSDSSCPAPVETPRASLPTSRCPTPFKASAESPSVPTVVDDNDQYHDQIRLLSPVSTALLQASDHTSLANTLLDGLQPEPSSPMRGNVPEKDGNLNVASFLDKLNDATSSSMDSEKSNYEDDSASSVDQSPILLHGKRGFQTNNQQHDNADGVETIGEPTTRSPSASTPHRRLFKSHQSDDDPSETTMTSTTCTDRPISPTLSYNSGEDNAPTEVTRATEILDQILSDDALSPYRQNSNLSTTESDSPRQSPPRRETSGERDRPNSADTTASSSSKTVVTPSGKRIVLRKTNPAVI